MWVAVLNWSARTAAKIRQLHHIEVEDVRDAVQCKDLEYVWDYDDERGWRVIVTTRINGRLVDFYEGDEPLEKIKAAYARGEKRRTVPPRGQTVTLDVLCRNARPGTPQPPSISKPTTETAARAASA